MMWLKTELVLTLTILETSSQRDEDCVCGVGQSGAVPACGRSGRVAGGDQAELGEFPWMALLVIRRPGKDVKRCGGTLINDRWAGSFSLTIVFWDGGKPLQFLLLVNLLVSSIIVYVKHIDEASEKQKHETQDLLEENTNSALSS